MKNSTNLAEGIGQIVVIPVVNTIFGAIGEIAKFSLVVLFTFCIAHLLLANVYDVERRSSEMISMASFERSAELITMEEVASLEGKKSNVLLTAGPSKNTARQNRPTSDTGEETTTFDHSSSSAEILTHPKSYSKATDTSDKPEECKGRRPSRPVSTTISKQVIGETDTENPKL